VTPHLPLADIEPTAENQPFWDALRDNRIDLPYCQRCRSFVWYPRAICPLCHQGGLTWRTLPGTGRVYSQTVVTKGTGRWKDAGPYVVAYVQLDSGIDNVDGPRILTNIVGDDSSVVSIGSLVCFVIDRSDDANRVILRFALA